MTDKPKLFYAQTKKKKKLQRNMLFHTILMQHMSKHKMKHEKNCGVYRWKIYI